MPFCLQWPGNAFSLQSPDGLNQGCYRVPDSAGLLVCFLGHLGYQAEEKGKWGGLGEGWGRCQQTQGGLGPRACAEVSKANWSVPKAINSGSGDLEKLKKKLLKITF